jgi:hypothetical protein
MKSLVGSVSALWRKAEREAYRAFHARSKSHKADHFLNFCITAHALRDHFIEERGVQDGNARRLLHEEWNAEPLLVAVSEIANLSKHFQLRDSRSGAIRQPHTRRVVHRLGFVVDVYVAPSGEIRNVPRRAPEMSVTTSDGSQHYLWEFQIDVLDYWQLFLERGAQFTDSPPGT